MVCGGRHRDYVQVFVSRLTNELSTVRLNELTLADAAVPWHLLGLNMSLCDWWDNCSSMSVVHAQTRDKMEKLLFYCFRECFPHHRFDRKTILNWENFISVCSNPETLVSRCLNASQPTRKGINVEKQWEINTLSSASLYPHTIYLVEL